MSGYRKNPSSLLETLLFAVTLGTLAIVGCGSDQATGYGPTAPVDYSLTSAPDQAKIERIPTPVGFEVTDLCAGGAILRWTPPQRSNLHARIQVDGVVVAMIDAHIGYYQDTLAKVCGEHTWSITYMHYSLSGTEVQVTLTMPAPSTDNRTDRRMERDS